MSIPSIPQLHNDEYFHNLFIDLAEIIGERWDQKGWCHATCPSCGKEAHEKQTHFHFNEKIARCFVCDYQEKTWTLARKLVEGTEAIPRTNPLPPRPKILNAEPYIPPWDRPNGHAFLRMYYKDADRNNEEWGKYKPIGRQAIKDFELGVGPLPRPYDNGGYIFAKQECLIVPIWHYDKLMGIRGRRLKDNRWDAADGTKAHLFNCHAVEPDQTVVISENIADAIWMDSTGLSCGCAISGTAWLHEWSAFLQIKRPSKVILCFDNDEAGRDVSQRAAHSLLLYNINTHIFFWPDDAPDKADLGWLLAREKI